MEHRSNPHLLLFFTFLYVFCSQAIALPPLGSYSAIRNNSPLDEKMPVKHHSDTVFTDNYSRLRKQMALKKYLESVLTGKRSQEDLNPPNLQDEVELLEPAFSENYEDVTVDDLPLPSRLTSEDRPFKNKY